MQRVDLIDVYALPSSYNPPEISQLCTNTQYPNLNSIEYRFKESDKTLKIQKFQEHIDINEFGNVVLGCNSYTDRVWDGSFWGFEGVEDFGDESKASYKLSTKSPITNIRYTEANMVSDNDLIITIYKIQ